ncbi:hypothetical protein OIV83_004676 [Microbotryomycetes sp. JL201]|nr:hypothetical protein OIV83_004676 [Microbotryomycetes sp. JL201]
MSRSDSLCSTSSSPSLFSSTRSAESVATDPAAGEVGLPDASTLSKLGVKAETINLPLILPSSPHSIEPVDVHQLRVDAELESLPIGLVLSKLQSIVTSRPIAA